MKFDYLARNQKGETQTGTIEAVNEGVALRTLQSRNLIVIKLKSTEKVSLLTKRIGLFERVKRKELFVFFRQLSIMVGADVPLVQSLRALSRQTKNRYFEEILFNVTNNVDAGMSFSKSLARYPKVFSVFSINLIKTGEVAGRLQESLNYLADYLEREYYLISRVRGAMIYPAFILAAFVIVGVLVMTMVMPQLTAILLESGQDLPLPTKIIIAVSTFMREWIWLFFLLAVGGGIFTWQFIKTKQGRALWDTAKLKLPLFGGILQKTYLARLSDNLSALVKGGVSIIQSLTVAAEVIGNVVFQNIILKTRDEVKMGQSISSSLEKYEEFPPLFTQMIKTGEQTGKLEVILDKLSDFYNKEVENIVENLSQLIEPVLIVILGVGVSILVFAVFMPIYNLVGAF